MNIRELQLFRHLSGTLHFGRTSQACNITPSGLSRTIQRLEEMVGKSLFVRDKRSVELTEAGRIFQEYADDAIQRWETLQHSLSEDGVLRGELSLYCSVTAILSILPEILERFRKAYPEILIHLQTGDAAMALSKLQNRDVDVTIAALPDTLPRRLEFFEIIKTPLIFIGSRGYPGSVIRDEKGKIDWHKTPLILAERGLSRKRVERWFADKGIVPNIYAQVAGNEAIITMVSLGCGVGVIPELVLEKSPLQDQVSVLVANPELEPFAVGVCTSSKNRSSPIVQAFMESVEKG